MRGGASVAGVAPAWAAAFAAQLRRLGGTLDTERVALRRRRGRGVCVVATRALRPGDRLAVVPPHAVLQATDPPADPRARAALAAWEATTAAAAADDVVNGDAGGADQRVATAALSASDRATWRLAFLLALARSDALWRLLGESPGRHRGGAAGRYFPAYAAGGIAANAVPLERIAAVSSEAVGGDDAGASEAALRRLVGGGTVVAMRTLGLTPSDAARAAAAEAARQRGVASEMARCLAAHRSRPAPRGASAAQTEAAAATAILGAYRGVASRAHHFALALPPGHDAAAAPFPRRLTDTPAAGAALTLCPVFDAFNHADGGVANVALLDTHWTPGGESAARGNNSGNGVSRSQRRASTTRRPPPAAFSAAAVVDATAVAVRSRALVAEAACDVAAGAELCLLYARPRAVSRLAAAGPRHVDAARAAALECLVRFGFVPPVGGPRA